MGCCEVLMKAILIITNVIVLLAGAILLIVGGVFYAKQHDFFPDLPEYSLDVGSTLIAMMVIGGILFLVGFIGCLGACSGKSGLLNIYFIVILIVVILELVIIILAVVKKDEFEEAAEDAAKTLFTKYQDKYMTGGAVEITDAESSAVNFAQHTFECCGLSAAGIWGNGDFPPGCCSKWDQSTWEKDANRVYKISACPTGSTKYTVNCNDRIEQLMEEFGWVIIIIIIVIIAFEILCMIAACVSKKKNYVA